jgi:hypothetical protein
LVLRLGHPVLVGLGEFTFRLARGESNGKLRHGMAILGQRVHGDGRELGVPNEVQFGRQGIGLFLGGDLSTTTKKRDSEHGSPSPWPC